MQLNAFNTVIENEIQEYRFGDGWNVLFDPKNRIFSLPGLLFISSPDSPLSAKAGIESLRTYYRTDGGSVVGTESNFEGNLAKHKALDPETQQLKINLDKKNKQLFHLEQKYYSLSNRFSVVPEDIAEQGKDYDEKYQRLNKLREEMPVKIATLEEREKRQSQHQRLAKILSGIFTAVIVIAGPAVGAMFFKILSGESWVLGLGISLIALSLAVFTFRFVIGRRLQATKSAIKETRGEFESEERRLKDETAFVDGILEDSGFQSFAEFIQPYSEFQQMTEKISVLNSEVSALENKFSTQQESAVQKILEYEKQMAEASEIVSSILFDRTQPSEAAIIEYQKRLTEPVPILLNDPFDHNQLEETSRILKILSEISENFQIILLTASKECKEASVEKGAKLLVVQG